MQYLYYLSIRQGTTLRFWCRITSSGEFGKIRLILSNPYICTITMTYLKFGINIVS